MDGLTKKEIVTMSKGRPCLLGVSLVLYWIVEVLSHCMVDFHTTPTVGHQMSSSCFFPFLIYLFINCKMDSPQLVQSKYDKVQLIDQGFLLCRNKSRGNKHYFRCTLNKPTQCKATAIVIGSLEEGQFEVVHHVEKH